MKVTEARSRVLETPADRQTEAGVPSRTGRQFVTLELGTDEGLWGLGYADFRDPQRALTQREAIDDLCQLLVGEDPLEPEAISAKLRKATTATSQAGSFGSALAVIDIALWDIAGKAMGQPVSKLLGGYRERIPAYASGRLLRSFSVRDLEEAGTKLVEQGFHAVKLQIGGQEDPEKEVERVKVLRQIIGDSVDLLVDVNQLWSVDQAIDIGHRMEPYHLYWLEDPVHHDDFQGLAHIARTMETPIVAGENLSGIDSFRQMLEARSVDIVMISVLRVGGITQWRKVAGMAEAFGLPVVSFHAPEIQVHLVSAVPNGLTVEHMPWASALFKEVPALEDGQLVVPQKPGLGLELDEEAVRRYQVT